MLTIAILLIAAGLWMLVLVLTISLRRAAQAGLDTPPAGYEPADEPDPLGVRGSSLHGDVRLGSTSFDLEAHPRPTRSAPRSGPSPTTGRRPGGRG